MLVGTFFGTFCCGKGFCDAEAYRFVHDRLGAKFGMGVGAFSGEGPTGSPRLGTGVSAGFGSAHNL